MIVIKVKLLKLNQLKRKNTWLFDEDTIENIGFRFRWTNSYNSNISRIVDTEDIISIVDKSQNQIPLLRKREKISERNQSLKKNLNL